MIILSPLFEKHYYQTELEKFGYELIMNEELFISNSDFKILDEIMNPELKEWQVKKVKQAGEMGRKKTSDIIQSNMKTEDPGFLQKAATSIGNSNIGQNIHSGIQRALDTKLGHFAQPTINKVGQSIGNTIAKFGGKRLNNQVKKAEKLQSQVMQDKYKRDEGGLPEKIRQKARDVGTKSALYGTAAASLIHGNIPLAATLAAAGKATGETQLSNPKKNLSNIQEKSIKNASNMVKIGNLIKQKFK
jgi:hypothetical protein